MKTIDPEEIVRLYVEEEAPIYLIAVALGIYHPQVREILLNEGVALRTSTETHTVWEKKKERQDELKGIVPGFKAAPKSLDDYDELTPELEKRRREIEEGWTEEERQEKQIGGKPSPVTITEILTRGYRSGKVRFS